MADKRRTSGWVPIEDLRVRGEPALTEVLADAIRREGRVERATHGFHTYPAGLHPRSAWDLLAVVEGRRLLDPFCGGGTTLVEGLVKGREVVGSDLSPVACLVARTRCWLATPEEITAVRSAGRRITARARESAEPVSIPDPELERWYDPGTLRELALLRRGIEEADPAARGPLLCCLSSILVKVSYRESDTSMKRAVSPRPPGTTAVLFHKKVRELGRRLEDLARRVPEGTPAAQILEGDARELSLETPADGVITSPPYPGVYDYLPLQALRVAWLGLDDAAGRRLEIASRRDFRAGRREAARTWRQQTAAWMARCAGQVVGGGRIAVVIGDGLVGDVHIDALGATLEAGRAAGLRHLAHASGARVDHARGSRRWEHALLFER